MSTTVAGRGVVVLPPSDSDVMVPSSTASIWDTATAMSWGGSHWASSVAVGMSVSAAQSSSAYTVVVSRTVPTVSFPPPEAIVTSPGS